MYICITIYAYTYSHLHPTSVKNIFCEIFSGRGLMCLVYKLHELWQINPSWLFCPKDHTHCQKERKEKGRETWAMYKKLWYYHLLSEVGCRWEHILSQKCFIHLCWLLKSDVPKKCAYFIFGRGGDRIYGYTKHWRFDPGLNMHT